MTSDRSLFAGLAGLGKRLVSLHLMELEGEDAPAYPATGDNRVEKVRYAPPVDTTPGRVFINRSQYFEGVAPTTWQLAIGGYRPAEKWLKDRKGRTLSYENITHYRSICAALAETPLVMARIDEAIESHGAGRWPDRLSDRRARGLGSGLRRNDGADRVEMALGCGMMRHERLCPILTPHGSHYRLYDPTGAVGAGPAV